MADYRDVPVQQVGQQRLDARRGVRAHVYLTYRLVDHDFLEDGEPD